MPLAPLRGAVPSRNLGCVSMIAPRRMLCSTWSLAACSALGFAVQTLAQSAPQVVPLQTSDGVQLKVTYYPSKHPKGSPQAKQVTPVVLLHDYKETRAVFAALA